MAGKSHYRIKIPVDFFNESGAYPLHSICSCFIHRFARGNVRCNFFCGEFIKFNLAAAKLKQFGHSAKEFEYLVKGFRSYRIPFYKVFWRASPIFPLRVLIHHPQGFFLVLDLPLIRASSYMRSSDFWHSIRRERLFFIPPKLNEP